MSTSRVGYHHGDLRTACLTVAMELLAEGDEGTVSLRAVTRRARVSPNAVGPRPRLASLVMDGKLPGDDRQALDTMVRSTVDTMLGVQASPS